MITEFYESIDSTNSEASRQLDILSGTTCGFSALHKKVICAKTQTAGRGRMNRSFFSPSSGVYMSLIYCPEQRDVFDPAFYTAAAAVSVCRTVSKFFKKETTIKWVNDIYSDGKKISGILTEGKIDSFTGKIGAIVVGIGVNVNTPKNGFPEEIKNRAGAILEKEIDFDFRVFVDALAEEVFKVFDLIPDSVNQVMNEYRNKSNLIGKKVTVTPVIESDEGKYEAIVEDISQEARLIVRLSDGTKRELSSGEVTLHV